MCLAWCSGKDSASLLWHCVRRSHCTAGGPGAGWIALRCERVRSANARMRCSIDHCSGPGSQLPAGSPRGRNRSDGGSARRLSSQINSCWTRRASCSAVLPQQVLNRQCARAPHKLSNSALLPNDGQTGSNPVAPAKSHYRQVRFKFPITPFFVLCKRKAETKYPMRMLASSWTLRSIHLELRS